MKTYGKAAKVIISHNTMPNDHTSLACVNTPSSKLCNKQNQAINSQVRQNRVASKPLVQANAQAPTHPHACDNLQ
jgi:hypothetical protein